jgi:hypothetical protein
MGGSSAAGRPRGGPGDGGAAPVVDIAAQRADQGIDGMRACLRLVVAKGQRLGNVDRLGDHGVVLIGPQIERVAHGRLFTRRR